MNTGRAGILLILAVLASGCATQEPDAILSASELESMIRVEVRTIEAPAPNAPVAEAVIALNDQP